MTISIVFIDSRVANYQSIIDSLTEPAQVFILNGESDGLAQMAADLQGQTGIDVIHVISHGSQGALYLGSTVLDSDNLAAYGAQLASIGSVLTQTGDVLLYGCNVAQGDAGVQFINSLAQYTGADMAASSDATGAAHAGGNWILERNIGVIEAIPMALVSYPNIFSVDTTAPVLTSLSIPSNLDVSKGTAGLTISGTATDDLSGVKQVVVYFDHNLTYSFKLGDTSFSTNSFFGNYGIYDSWSDGTSTQTWGIASTNASGVYNVTSVVVQDVQSNTRTYTSAQLAGMGINTSITLSDGIFVPNALTALPSIEQGKLVLSLSASNWSSVSNALQFTVGYDSTVVHFDSWRAGSPGGYSVSSSVSEIGASGTANISANISNGGDNTDFIQLVFSTTTQKGDFAYSLTSETLNSLTLASIFGNYSFSNIDTTAATPTITGSTGNDSLTGSSGNDIIDGGAGVDTAVYSGNRTNFALIKNSTGFTLIDNTGAQGTDTLQNVERIKFSDGGIALDVGATQPAGETALLLGAVMPGRLVFDSTKQVLLGAVIDLFDQGYTLQQLSGAVMRLPIWDVLTGKAAPTSTNIANYLLANVNGVVPDAATLASGVTSLNTETDINHNQGDFLWHLAESVANQTHVGLVGLVSTGLAYGA